MYVLREPNRHRVKGSLLSLGNSEIGSGSGVKMAHDVLTCRQSVQCLYRNDGTFIVTHRGIELTTHVSACLTTASRHHYIHIYSLVITKYDIFKTRLITQ